MKLKKKTITTKELEDAIKNTQKVFSINPLKQQEEAEEGLKTFLSDTPTPFDCKNCGKNFTPAPHQWIFYKLCDKCFSQFDSQKMKGRFSMIGGKRIPYFEDVDAWIQSLK